MCRYLKSSIEIRRMAEIGVWCGEAAEILASELKPETYYAVDAWTPGNGKDWRPYEQAMSEFERAKERISANVIVLRGDSQAMAAQVENASLDFVYIDANHSYASVRADIRAWRPKVREGGIIAGHDYAYASNARRKKYGVVRAVNEIFFCPDMLFDDSSWLVRLSDRNA